MPTIKLPSGASFTGTNDELDNFALRMGITTRGEKYYYSVSKDEFLFIPSMVTEHIRNAVLVRYTEWLQTLRKCTPDVFCRKIIDGPVTDPVIVHLMTEMLTRK